MAATHSRRPAEIWPLVHAERAALTTDMAHLTDEQWSTRSLCSELSVREVLAHLTAAANLNGLRWFAGVVRCRFDFDKQVVMRLTEQLGDSPAETLDRFRRAVTNKTKPPLPVIAMLGETIVHGEDIRHPLAIHHDSPIATLTRIAEYYRSTDQVVIAKKRVKGLRLVATDGPFTAGEGPLVSGRTLALIMAMTGRTRFCDELHGDGVPTLRDRSSAYDASTPE